MDMKVYAPAYNSEVIMRIGFCQGRKVWWLG